MPSTNTYDINDTVRVSAIFTVNGVDTDPTTITLKVKDPSGNVDTYTFAAAEITKTATGRYCKDISVDESGVWYYHFGGTGTVPATAEHQFVVRRSEF